MDIDKQLAQDIDVWCTVFLDYAPREGGSWGNHGDMVYQVLMASAEAAYRRNQELGDAVRERILQTFLRSGMAPERAHAEASRAGQLFSDVQMFLASPRRQEYLERNRTLPLHHACNPATDQRFAKPPRRMVYRNGEVEAWLCATDAELIEDGLDEIPPGGGCEYLHRDDGPALIAKMGDGILEEVWFQHGQVHREGSEPAWTWTLPDGTRTLERWYTDGIMEREVDVRSVG